MKNIIYIDNYYPYSYKGETFLQNEIDFLSEQNKKIKRFIFPIYGKNIIKEKIKIHKDLTIIEPSKNSVIYRLLWIFPCFFNFDFYAEIKELISNKKFNLNNFIKCLKFISEGLICSNILIKYIKRNFKKDDCIVLYSYWMYVHAFVAAVVKKKLYNYNNIKFITRCHRFDVYEYANEDYIPFRNIIYKNVDKIYSISNDAIKYIKENYNYKNLNCEISMLGTFDNGISISKKGRTLKILSCSWMRAVKRIDLIFEAIKNTNFDIEWCHIGDGDEFDKIKNLIDSNGNKKLKCKLLGAMPNSEIIDYYRNEDVNVFLNVSESEGIPVSIMEAMSFGKIIIATDTGGVNEIVFDNENGFLLPIEFTSEELFSKLKAIFEMNNNNYNIMSKKSRNIWEEKCNAEFNYLAFEKDMFDDEN